MLGRVFEESLAYLVFGGIATAPVVLFAAVMVGALAVRNGVSWWLQAARRVGVFGAVLFLCGLPANVAFTLVMRDRFYTDNDPIIDWLPWVPSGDWIIDWACQGRYLEGASAWTLRIAWAVLAVPVWAMAIVAFRALPSRFTGRVES